MLSRPEGTTAVEGLTGGAGWEPRGWKADPMQDRVDEGESRHGGPDDRGGTDPSRERPAEPYRVLVVDDSQDVRGVVRALLTLDGRFAVVAEAPDGMAGVQAARLQQPDLVLLDIAMPKLDGLAALPRIRSAAPASAVVVLSAFGTDRMVHAALAEGAAGFVHKSAGLAQDLMPACLQAVGAAVPGRASLG